MEKVYFKDYSGLDKTTAWGTIADDNYRNNEMKKCLEIKKIILENSNLIQTENIKTIKFGDTELNYITMIILLKKYMKMTIIKIHIIRYYLVKIKIA
ncbi:MAG: hypothetical protein ACLTXR_04715 [Clostridia bacterium]